MPGKLIDIGRAGDIITTAPKFPLKRHLKPKQYPLMVAQRGIQAFQWLKFLFSGGPKSDTHVLTLTSPTALVHWTYPQAKAEPVHILEGQHIRLWRPIHYELWKHNEALDTFWRFLNNAVGDKVQGDYDESEYLRFLLSLALEEPVKLAIGPTASGLLGKARKMIGLGGGHVCSTGATAVNIHLNLHHPDIVPRWFRKKSGGHLLAEDVSPAHFGNWQPRDFKLILEDRCVKL